MADYTYIGNHVELAKEKLAGEFRKPKIEGFLGALITPWQGLEDAHLQLADLRWVDTAMGVQLDLFGSIVGESRKGKTDEQYRRFIRARILINTSKGLPENLIKLFNLIAETSGAIYMTYRPAEITIFGNSNIENLIITADEILFLCREIIPAGVTLDHIGYYPGNDGFRTSDYWKGADPDFGKGFDDYFNPGIGGKLAHISAF
jgi:hypothetical protein